MAQDTDLKYLANAVAKNDESPELFSIIFAGDNGIDKEKMLSFLRQAVENEASVPVSLPAVLDALKTDDELFTSFLSQLLGAMSKKLYREAGYDRVSGRVYNEVMHPSVFWMLMTISMKKCLGTECAKATATLQELANMLPPLNGDQRYTHDQCINYFGLDGNGFANKDLGIFLHKFHSKNKQARTKKKNLHRVTRRVKKMMQVYQLPRGGSLQSMFSNGRHEVPEQFDMFLTSKFLTSKKLSRSRQQRVTP